MKLSGCSAGYRGHDGPLLLAALGKCSGGDGPAISVGASAPICICRARASQLSAPGGSVSGTARFSH